MHNTSNYAKKLYDRAIELNCLKFGDFTLSSGAKSSYYFDGRLLSLDSIGSELISESFLNILDHRPYYRLGYLIPNQEVP